MGAIRVVPFTSATGGGFPQAQVISVPTGRKVGGVPKGAFVMLGGATGLDAIEESGVACRVSAGAYDGTTSRCVAFMAETGLLSGSNVGWRTDTATVIQLTNATGPTLLSEAAVTAIAEDEITVTWSADPGTRRGYVVFVYGSDARVNVQHFTSHATAANDTVVNGMGFTPDWCLATSAGVGATISADNSGNSGGFAMGFAARLPSTTYGCCAITGEDLADPTSSGCIARSDAMLSIPTLAAGVASEHQYLTIQSWDADGVTVRSGLTAAGIDVMLFSVSFGGRIATAGAPVTNVTGLGDVTVATPGFVPLGLFVLGNRNATLATAANSAGGMSIAAYDGTQLALVAPHHRDNQGTSESSSLASETSAVALPSSTSAYDWKATLTNWSPFVLNVDDVAGANRAVPFLVVGERKELPGLYASLRRWRWQLGRM